MDSTSASTMAPHAPVRHIIVVCCGAVLRHPCSHYRRVKSAGAVTFYSQINPRTSTWFDHPAEDSSRPSHTLFDDVIFSSTFSRRISSSSSIMLNSIDQLYEVQSSRTPSALDQGRMPVRTYVPSSRSNASSQQRRIPATTYL